MELESSSSSFSKPKSQWTYDVFINFRGEDTRRSFVCHLNCALSKAGVKTFLDEENLHKGMKLDELMTAIEGSQIAIVVFSKSYTESTWCLRELEKVIECNETYGQSVLPVFYNIDPSVVRHRDEKHDFGKVLKIIQENIWKMRLSRWSRALSEASKFSGWDASKFRNDAELVEKIVEDVLTKIEYDVLPITKFPVGLKSRVQKVIGFIENQSTRACIIVIWGMGGSGKTTAAKAIYNEINCRFGHKSFIEDIREVYTHGPNSKGHVHLQEQLLSDVLNTKVKIHSIGMGTTMIENRLSGKRVLIVLDDVNEIRQLEDLCGNCEWFGQGSVIIITTRDAGVLNLFKVDYVYEMEEMDENESLELFCLHAFGEPNPKEDFNELARNVVAYCGGLLLALEVLGSYLRGRRIDEWESVLSKLKQIPNYQVQEKLRISFDGLRDPMEKDIFLYVCCFFIAKDKAYVTEILNGCGLHADIGIPVLIERSLIKIEKNNKLGMHPLLQQMGREIIRGSSIKEPGKRSRLWFHEDVLDVLIVGFVEEIIKNRGEKRDNIYVEEIELFYSNSNCSQ
ncbi:TMV resistance protein N [Glycine soja]|uniref:TMV resistance protein N n=1 Tax=Glycine soja TaxID=3848 RepID=A0A0B2PS46_GLYSO|nr:TMV resistance protein N [Glycine soja]